MPNTTFEPIGRVRTKIVATIGPASRSPEMLRRLIVAGVDVFRLNFSHGSHAEHSANVAAIREAAAELGRDIAILQDLGGPKIRLGVIPGDAVDCRLEDTFELVEARTRLDDPSQLTCTYRELADDLKVGDDVYFADGAVAMVVTETAKGVAKMRVTLAGRVRSHQGLNLPGSALNVKAITEKDLLDLDWTAKNDIDYVGLSFVREASDVVWLRDELERRGSRARIVSKIEKPQAVANLDAIIAATDAVMVARGDLGVEMDVARVPAIQKRIIAACHQARIPVITATQMLNSMESSNRPTRAEATDVFNAVLDGTDAVMLSGETAVGLYPVETVSMMSRILTEAEELLLGDPNAPWPAAAAKPPTHTKGQAGWVQPITEAVVEAVRMVSRRLSAELVIVATNSGRTALALSKQKYAAPTIALTNRPEVARAMALYWGVTPVHYKAIADGERVMEFAVKWAKSNELVSSGDVIVVVEGTMPSNLSHNTMQVEMVE